MKKKKPVGLFYRNALGEEMAVAKGNKILLTIELDQERDDCCIKNYFDGLVNESYRNTKLDQAVVDMVALLNGYQPPRSLYRRDIPSH